MAEDTFIKDPAVVDARFNELSDLKVHPDRLDFAPIAPTGPSMRGGYGDVRQALLRPYLEAFRPDGTRSCGKDIQVAVKKLKDLEYIDLPRRKRMIVRELLLLSKVEHPNIVPFRGFHVDFEESVAWLISDWVPFGNVSDYLHDPNRHVGLDERLRLLSDTITALTYMHSLDPPICHGDIKAANVLVGQAGQAMLCDFGLARIIEDENFKSLETSADFKGSIPWCSPEVLGGKRASLESDVWAFGFLVWEVVTGTTPFANLRHPAAIVTAIIQGNLPQPEQDQNFQQIPLLGSFMKQCWHKDPAGRPSAQASSSMLVKVLDATETRGVDDVEKAQGSWLTRVLSLATSCGGARRKEPEVRRGQRLPENIKSYSSPNQDPTQLMLTYSRTGAMDDHTASATAIRHERHQQPTNFLSPAPQPARSAHSHVCDSDNSSGINARRIEQQKPLQRQHEEGLRRQELLRQEKQKEMELLQIRQELEQERQDTVARGTLCQPSKPPASTASQSNPQQTKALTGVGGANRAPFPEVLKKTEDQPVQPFQPTERPVQSSWSRERSKPLGLLPSRSLGGESSPSSTRPSVKNSTSVPRELYQEPIQRVPPTDLEISQLSSYSVGDYILDPVGSRSTVGSEDSGILDRFDFTERLVDVMVATFGGLSDVKKGRIDGSNIIVAIKVIRTKHLGPISQALGDQQVLRLRKRLARELRIWLFLRHPRILELLGFAFIDDQPCLLSPWCKNGNVKEYLAQNPDASRKSLAVQVTEGLLYLHSRNPIVVHGDLKPVNILVTDDGDAVVCDFGISKQPGEASTGLTTSQDAFMSLRYAAPEILQNLPPSTKSDVYGFGCVALELFTGQCPHFNVTNTAGLITRIIQGPMSDPTEYPRLPITSPLWNFFRRCWATDPDERPNMQEAHDELVAI